jgi:spore photoproduct lyase
VKEFALLLEDLPVWVEELPEPSLDILRRLHAEYGLSHQQSRQLVEAARDLSMWQEKPLEQWVESRWLQIPAQLQKKQARDRLIREVLTDIEGVRSGLKSYQNQVFEAPKRSPQKIVVDKNERKLLGDCPVYSEKLVCCQLKTLDVVQNCSFGCSYCTIQTFYGDEVSIDGNLQQKLLDAEHSLDMHQFQHIGTGQSSDSLVWGNRNGMLQDLCAFAARNPKVLLEFKTKSANVKHLLALEVPKNVVCSWSLNTSVIVDNEEHFAASLDKRLAAARQAADKGIKVAFHFHPIVYYDGWAQDYPALVQRVLSMFKPEEVLFVSMGSVTFIKPVIQKIRESGRASKILQMEMVPDPHGKLSYPDAIKLELFSAMYEAFRPWRNRVFQYLCMERAYFWHEVFGWSYPNNDHFAAAFAHSVWTKIYTGAELESMLESLAYPPLLHST